MPSGYLDVMKFHQKFGIATPEGVQSLAADVAEFRQKFLHEELREFAEAHGAADVVGAVDALIDLVYVAYGTALLMGVTPEQWAKCWAAVQEANMSKVRCESAAESKRGHSLDVRKPEGWVAPTVRQRQVLGV